MLKMSYRDHLPFVVRRHPSLVRRQLSVHTFERSSLKPLSQFSSNYMWSLLLKCEWTFVQMIAVQDGRHAHIWQKHLKIFSRTENTFTLNLGI